MSAIKQSFSYWCFDGRFEPATMLAEAKKIGFNGVDLIDEKLWPLVQDSGLELAAMNGHASIDEGLNRRENAARIERELQVNIEKAVRWKIPALICFSGARGGQEDATGLSICTETLGRIAPVAEQAGVALVVELLNSKVDHPDYQCDHTAWGVELCRRVNSPAVKLLYDIYHMQIMEGDLIRAINQHHAYFGHYHTAGNPGRGPLDADQEIYYPPVYRAIAATRFAGYIGHEFVPRKEPLRELRAAFEQCAESIA